MLVNQVGDAKVITSFLVSHGGEKNVPRQGNFLGFGLQESRQHHSNASLHVQGAAAPNKTINDIALERGMSPFLSLRADHIHVPVEQQGRGDAFAFQLGDQVGTSRCTRHNVSFDASFFEQSVNVLDTSSFIAGWVGGIKADQVLQ